MRWVVAPWQRWEFRGRPARRCALRPLILQQPGRPEPWSELELLDGSGTIALVTDQVDVALGAKGLDALPDVPLMGRLGDASASDRAMLLDLLRSVGLRRRQIKQALGADTSAARFAALIDVLTDSTPTPSVDRNGEIVVDAARRVARARPIPGLAAGGAFPTTSVLSTFTGANGATPTGMSDNPTADLDSGLRIQGNQGTAGSNTYSGSWWNAAQFGPDVEAGMTLATRPTPNNRYSAVFLRVASPGTSGVDGYQVWCEKLSGTDTVAVERITNQSYTSVGASISQEFSAGDGFGADMIGNTITIYRKPSVGSWGALATRTDSTYSGSGYIGWESDDTTSRIDDAFGGTVVAGGITATVGMVVETSTSLAFAKRKAKSFGQATEADTARGVTPSKGHVLGSVTETSAGQAFGKAKARSFNRVSESESARQVRAGRVYGMGRVSEGDAALSPGRVKARGVARVSESDVSRPLSRALIRLLGRVSESDSAFGLSPVAARVVPVVMVVESSVARAFGSVKAKAFGRASESSAASAFGRTKSRGVGAASEVDEARGWVWLRRRLVGRVEEVDEALPMRAVIGGDTRGHRGSAGASTRVLVGAAGSSTRGTSGSPGSGSDR